MIVVGIRDDGYREILGARMADGEDELFWSGLFQDLKDRGLFGVQLVISDGHKGIQKAVEKSFLGASWQMCHVHLVRAALRNVAKKYHKEIAGKLKVALEDENKMLELVQEPRKQRIFQSCGYHRAFSVQPVELQGISDLSSEEDQNNKRIGENQQGAEKKNKSCRCISK